MRSISEDIKYSNTPKFALDSSKEIVDLRKKIEEYIISLE